jgi:hypothetical protein
VSRPAAVCHSSANSAAFSGCCAAALRASARSAATWYSSQVPVARAGGFRISDGFISPLDLIDVGLMSAEEAKELHDIETAGAAT